MVREIMVPIVVTLLGIFIWIGWVAEDITYAIVATALIVVAPLALGWFEGKTKPSVARIVLSMALPYVSTVLVYALYGMGVMGTNSGHDAQAFYILYPLALLTVFIFVIDKLSGGG